MISQNYFNDLVAWATATLQSAEVLLCSFAGENTDFIRFNGGAVRQAGSVSQGVLNLQLIEGQRHAQASVALSGDASSDQHRCARALTVLREQRAQLLDDPYLSFNTAPNSTEHISPDETPDSESALRKIQAAAGDRDLVGIYTSGQTSSGFANSLGQHNWFETSTFNFDWTFYLRADKAAKNGYAGLSWEDDAFARKVDWSTQQLAALDRPALDLSPGEYRTYLAPAAVTEVVGLVSWGGFGMQSHRTKQTPLLAMIEGDARLAPSVRLSENTRDGVGPNFQEQGFLRPDEVVLIEEGAYCDTLVSPRSAKEFGATTNGASAHETPESLAIAAGDAPTATAMERLDTGLFVGNLWYTNFSDRPACRVTGMTRFATFWVEGGEVVAPVNVLRFDDSVYNLFGSKLEALDDEAEIVLDPMSYERRSNGSNRIPGALVNDMRYTL